MSVPPELPEAINKLIELLTLEKSRLLNGSYSGLEDITAQKQRYLAVLSGCLEEPRLAHALKPYQQRIEQISKLAADNEQLLTAAKNGVQSAQTRLKNLSAKESLVGAYTENGAKLHDHNAGVTRRTLA